MAENQLFPVFDLPEIPDNPEYDERYYPSVYFDFETGDFLRDGAGRMITSAGREAYMQWCLKVASTERLSCLAYSDDMESYRRHHRRIYYTGRKWNHRKQYQD